MDKYEKNCSKYCYFFYLEIKDYVGEQKSKSIEEEITSIDPKILSSFNAKRHECQNDSYVCSLIRNDFVEEFIAYVNQACISLTSKIKTSIFETNEFLIENEPTLIEYSAFYGSIQIFQYLQLNNVELKPNLWFYAIHSQNAELIHILE